MQGAEKQRAISECFINGIKRRSKKKKRRKTQTSDSFMRFNGAQEKKREEKYKIQEQKQKKL